jgi:hypothetical protein
MRFSTQSMPWRALPGSLRPSLTFWHGGMGRRRPTGIGGVPVHTGFEGPDPLQEGEELLLHARWGLSPIFSRDAESIRQEDWSKPTRVAHDAVSSCRVSLSLSPKEWRVSPKISVRDLHNVSYAVITDAGALVSAAHGWMVRLQGGLPGTGTHRRERPRPRYRSTRARDDLGSLAAACSPGAHARRREPHPGLCAGRHAQEGRGSEATIALRAAQASGPHQSERVLAVERPHLLLDLPPRAGRIYRCHGTTESRGMGWGRRATRGTSRVMPLTPLVGNDLLFAMQVMKRRPCAHLRRGGRRVCRLPCCWRWHAVRPTPRHARSTGGPLWHRSCCYTGPCLLHVLHSRKEVAL